MKMNAATAMKIAQMKIRGLILLNTAFLNRLGGHDQ